MNIINPYIHGGDEVAFDGFGNASRSFDGVSDYIDLGDSNDFSFGDGSNDSPFSISAWIKPNAHSFRILTKYNNDTTTREYTFTTDSSNRLIAYLYDQSSSSAIVRRCSSNLMSNYFGQWVHVVMTYDGSSTITGLKCFINAVREDDLDGGFGNYVSMENTNESAKIGVNGSTAYSNGNIADVRLYNSELSTTDISDLYNGTNITTNLVGHWIKDTPSLLDHAGSNDGTNYGSSWSPDNPSPAVEFGDASRSFDGSDDYINIGDVLDSVFAGTGKQFTVTAWIKTTTLENTDFFSKYLATGDQRSFLCRVLSDGNLAMVMSGDGAFGSNRFGRQTDTAPISANTWHHVAITYDQTATGDHLRMWVDGTEDATLTDWLSNGTFTSIYDGTANLRISGIDGGVNENWGGNIADVRVYDTDIPDSAIEGLAIGTDYQTNLVGWWLDDDDDVLDNAGSNDGTNDGSTYSLDNPSDKVEYGGASRSFSGGDRVHVADNVDLPTGSQTVSVWAKLNQTNLDQDLVSHWDIGDLSFIIFMPSSTGGQIRFYVSDDGSSNTFVQSTISLVASEWAHITCVFVPNTKMSIYIDGALAVEETSNIPSGLHDTAEKLSFGRREVFTGTPLNGKLADVRIYDTDLSSTEVYELYKGVDHRTNLIGQWLTNSDDVEDKAGTNDGTNYGSTYSTDAPL